MTKEISYENYDDYLGWDFVLFWGFIMIAAFGVIAFTVYDDARFQACQVEIRQPGTVVDVYKANREYIAQVPYVRFKGATCRQDGDEAVFQADVECKKKNLNDLQAIVDSIKIERETK